MARAKQRGLTLESFFEITEGDDISTDDIIPEVIKPTGILAKMKSKKVRFCFCFVEPLGPQFWVSDDCAHRGYIITRVLF